MSSPHPTSSPAAAIVVGDEILSGKIRDSNGPHLVDVLRGRGVAVGRILTVRDDVDEIAWAVQACLGRYRPIFTSGGIGPTHDDLTVAGVAKGLGVDVVRDPEIEALVRRHFGGSLTEEALRLANVPRGATLVRSSRSWYPVAEVREIFLLPGVPELFRMHLAGIADRYRGAPFHLRCVYLREGEAAIAAILDRVAAENPDVALGSYPRIDDPDHKVKLTLEGRSPQHVEAAFAQLLERLPAAYVIRVE